MQANASSPELPTAAKLPVPRPVPRPKRSITLGLLFILVVTLGAIATGITLLVMSIKNDDKKEDHPLRPILHQEGIAARRTTLPIITGRVPYAKQERTQERTQRTVKIILNPNPDPEPDEDDPEDVAVETITDASDGRFSFNLMDLRMFKDPEDPEDPPIPKRATYLVSAVVIDDNGSAISEVSEPLTFSVVDDAAVAPE